MASKGWTPQWICLLTSPKATILTQGANQTRWRCGCIPLSALARSPPGLAVARFEYNNFLGMSKRQHHNQAKQGRAKAFTALHGLGYRLVDAIVCIHMRHWTRTTPWRDHVLAQGRHFAHSVSIPRTPRYEEQSTQHGGTLYWLVHTLWEIDIYKATCLLPGAHPIESTV